MMLNIYAVSPVGLIIFLTPFLPTRLFAAGPLAGSRPNVVLILTDDQGYGDLSCHGNPVLRTPTLDRLHREGRRFTDFHVSPTCSPTRAALLTGRHEFRNGVTHTILERERLTPQAITLAQVLKSAGYCTGIFGKWHLGDEPDRWPSRRGFDEMFVHGAGGIGQSYAGSCGDVPGNRYLDPTILHNGQFVKTSGYCTDVFFARALSWIEQVKFQQPFFCYIATNAPHAPLDVPSEYEARYRSQTDDPRLAKFYGMIANIDDNVGRLLERLEDWQLTRNTLVIFMNDNGGTVGVETYNAGMRGAKVTPWLGGTRAASLWRWPDTICPADCDRLTAHIDVLPTLTELAGVPVADELQAQLEGRSLVPLLQDPDASWNDRTLFTHVGRWPKGANVDDYQFAHCSVRTQRWHLVCDTNGRKQWQLFDVSADAGESLDVAAQHAELVAQLDARYEHWWRSLPGSLLNEHVVGPPVNSFRRLYQQQSGGVTVVSAAEGVVSASFDRDPQWDAYRNERMPSDLPPVQQDFGHRPTNFAGGQQPGEIGGIVQRAYERASFAIPIAETTLDQPHSASGNLAVRLASGGSGVMVGWFHDRQSDGWRTPASLAFRIDGNGQVYRLFYEYGTSQWGTGGGGAFVGDAYQTTPTPPEPADGAVRRWRLNYDPMGADRQGLVTFRIDNRQYELPLAAGHKQQGAVFNRFGLWNVQIAGDRMEVYLDDLEVDGHRFGLTDAAGWIGERNALQYPPRVVRPFHQFGYRTSRFAGGAPGEIGGILFRDELPMYYADRVGPFSLRQELYASGTIAMRSAAADSALLLGWFNGEKKRLQSQPQLERPQTDYLGVMIEGPSRIGHFFRAAYATSSGSADAPTHEGTPQQRPVLRPDGIPHRWSLHYVPAEADGRGRITVTLDDTTQHLKLPAGAQTEDARFDRFGCFNCQAGGHHVELYLDDLHYRKGT